MTIQTIGLGTVDNDGTGDKPKAAGTKINSNFEELRRRVLSPMTRVCVMTDGDSKAVEGRLSLTWLASIKGLDIDFGPPSGAAGTYHLGVGGSNSGSTSTTNLTSAARMQIARETIQPLVAAGKTVDVSLRMFTNDAGSANDTVIANLAIYHANLRVAGVRYLLLWAPDLRGSTSNAANLNEITLDARLRMYAEANPYDCIYIPSMDSWLDPNVANSNGRPLKYTEIDASVRTYGSVNRDELHSSYYGDFRRWRPAWKALKNIYRRRAVPTLAKANAYSTGNTGGNLLGVNRRFVDLVTATNAVVNNGSGSVLAAGQVPTGMTSNTLTGTVQAGTIGVVLEQGTVAVTDEESILPYGTWPSLKFTFDGASDGAVTTFGVQLSLGGFPVTVTPNLAIGDKVRCGVILYLEGVKGLQGIQIGGFSGLFADSLGSKNMTGNPSPLAGAIPETLTMPVIFEGYDYTLASALSSANMTLDLALAPGSTLEGSIHVLLMYQFKV